MSDGILELGSAGLDSTDQRVRKLMDNIVNSEVPGYKKSDVVITAFPQLLEQASQKIATMKPQADSTYYNHLNGALVKTGNQLDLALGSDGFFVVNGSWGEGYTRDGRFLLDNEGRLLSMVGNYPVSGQNGAIVVTPGSKVEFSQQGDVIVDGSVVDRIRVIDTENKQNLVSINGSFFKVSSNAVNISEVADPRVIQGYVEASNVNIVDSMMEMIYLERQYNINTKVVSTRDGMLGKAMELGKTN